MAATRWSCKDLLPQGEAFVQFALVWIWITVAHVAKDDGK